ncbi:TPA: hypothetical protein ACGYJK_001829 [Listeria monocytogenes]|uniref:hypothetical protein n=1 Tax=Listeria monocytogenes TaxID=1639 RepID=UPI0015C95E59|nr:hypothetical protein [Listeria monocytogenes]HBI6246752.1 hypothetical protein [Listeria monocytogenes]HBI6543911.1 hypothetical protein [Listeria monocytogenes]HDT9309789.1 hypothetical protein [Listeria monocytogenes]HDU0349680.1 hypothetical protein [Listeria monocytogenes]
MNISQKDINEIAERKGIAPQEVRSEIMRLAQIGNTKEEIEKMVDAMKGRSD